MLKVPSFVLTTSGILGGVSAAPLRHVLIMTRNSLEELGLEHTVLRENIVVDEEHFFDLPSGTEIAFGESRLRLTFHCEPCAKISHLAKPSRLMHKRGYLASVTKPGEVKLGQRMRIVGENFPAIPYGPIDRIDWYLRQSNHPVDATKLLWEIGLPSGFSRALPRLLLKLDASLRHKVTFKKSKNDEAMQSAFRFA